MIVRHLLRAEAVNLASFVYDTARLPTVRGGGLLLLKAPQRIRKWLSEEEPRATNVETLRAGASAGVFAFDAQAGDGEAIRDALEGWLGGDPELKHATFVVDVVESTKDYQDDLEKLVARNHFRQMRSTSVAYPAQAGVVPCAVDGIRPGTEHGYLPGEDKANVSASVKLRTDHGRTQKQQFYRDEAGEALDKEVSLLEDAPFVRDFHDLADDPAQGRLDGKMAVLYFDGNGFGKLQEQLCKEAGEARRFDQVLQGNKKQLLAALLRKIHAEPAGWFFLGRNKTFHRFETLLWGGDEFLFVVPAWKGWWLLGEIYERMAEWKFGTMPLTFAAGLVLCSAKAPIRRMKALAQTLAEEAKAVSRTQSFAAYQVLESFDLVPGNFEEFRNRRSAGHDRQQMLVAGDQVKNLARAIEGLKPLLPRKRLYRLAEAILKKPGEVEECRTNLRGATAAPKQQADELWQALQRASQSAAAGELHLTELWDYIESITPAKEVALAG